MMIPKATTVRLKGVPLKKLVEAVYKRDNHECIICGAWVEDGVKPHHEPQGSRKSDELDKWCFYVCAVIMNGTLERKAKKYDYR